MTVRNRHRGRSRAQAGGASSKRSWAERWHSKSLMGHARTHPFATAFAATAAAGTGALLWANRGGQFRRSGENMAAMAI